MSGERKIDHERFDELYAQGMTDQDMAEEFGCSKVSVCLWRKRRGLSPNKGDAPNANVGRPRKLSALTLDEYRRIYRKSRRYDLTAAELEVSPRTLRTWLREARA